jgi:transcriptional regulator with XRE-family HTH domain
MFSNSTTSHQRATELRAERESAGLTRTKLAGLIGCSPTSLANIEGGAVPRRSAVLDRALAVLAAYEPGATP